MKKIYFNMERVSIHVHIHLIDIILLICAEENLVEFVFHMISQQF